MPLKFETRTQSLQDPAQSGASASPRRHQPRGCGAMGALVAEPRRELGDSGKDAPPLYPCGEAHRKSWADLETTVPKFPHLHALLPRRGKAEPGGSAAPAGEALTDRRHSQTSLPPTASRLRSIKSPGLNKTRCQ